MAMRFKRKKQINVMRIVMKLAMGILGLYAGGFTITILGQVMNGTCSPFYKGLKLIGWTVGSAYCTDTSATNANTVTTDSATSGILAVVGILAITLLVMFEFVDIQF